MAQSQPVPLGLMIRYGSGQVGAQIFRDTPAVLLPIFMTTMLGVPAWMAGMAVLAPKVWVLCCDPLIGVWSDRTKQSVGRGPFLMAGAVGTSLGFLSLFMFTHFPSPVIAAATICLIYLLASTAFSSFSVPYLAMASEMSDDPHERTRILAYRMGFTIAGVIFGVGVAQPLVFRLGGGALGWRIMAGVFAAICLASMLSAATGETRARTKSAQAKPTPLARQIATVFANRPYVVILATSFVQSISQACSYTVIGFFYLYVLGHVEMILPMVLCMSVGSLMAQPLWLSLSRRFGKKASFWCCCVVFVGLTLTWALVRPGTDVLFTAPFFGAFSTQDALVLLRGLVIGVFNGGFTLLTLSMLTDTIELERRLRGNADEGVFSGFFSAVEKLAFAIGPVIAGALLSASGFVSSTHGVVPQSAGAIQAIRMMYSFIPAGILVLSLIVFSFYGRALNRPTVAINLAPGLTAE